MAKLDSLDPRSLDIQDLDDIGNARKLIDMLRAHELIAPFTLNLRRCYLDYGPCALLVEYLVNAVRTEQGPETTLTIDTILDLGGAGNYWALLFRSASQMTGGPGELEQVRSNVANYLASRHMQIVVRVFEANADADAEPVHVVNPLVA